MFNKLLMQAVEDKLLSFFDVNFARLLANEQHPFLLLLSAYVSAKSREGHTCLPLEFFSKGQLFSTSHSDLSKKLWQITGVPSNLMKYLNSWNAISNGQDATPLVLSQNCIYLHRFWKNECIIANFFNNNYDINTFDTKTIRLVLDNLFNNHTYQKIAAATAITKKISIISGGPGTGKTTTVIKLLIAIIRLNINTIRIKLAAPTGKAASRLTDSLTHLLNKLSISPEEQCKLPHEATTLHRLLGAQYESKGMIYNISNKLPLDILVLDEVSMIDLSMMSNLVAALPEHAQVIFIGDRNQLPSIETGSIMNDLCMRSKNYFSPLRAWQLTQLTGCKIRSYATKTAKIIDDNICLLSVNYRFDSQSGINRLAQAVKMGNIKRVAHIFNMCFEDVNKKTITDFVDYQSMLGDILENYIEFLTLINKQENPLKIISAFIRHQVICPLRDGPFGVQGLNYYIEQTLIQRHLISMYSNNQHYLGRPIIITRNDSSLGLSNGDIGIILYYKYQDMQAFFIKKNLTIKTVELNRLPLHDTAWAITVHQSQGSEFDAISLVMPREFIPLLTRELIYTAITRPCKRLIIYTNNAVFESAIKNKTYRYSRLRNRIN
ncbi:exodeoxyribonuclease V subunit alpha [Candidatus Ishikawella capsulata]|nr:exodeoxyribonuclease V subunit alpha [Candidatus Ishikawaella capsulata]